MCYFCVNDQRAHPDWSHLQYTSQPGYCEWCAKLFSHMPLPITTLLVCQIQHSRSTPNDLHHVHMDIFFLFNSGHLWHKNNLGTVRLHSENERNKQLLIQVNESQVYVYCILSQHTQPSSYIIIIWGGPQFKYDYFGGPQFKCDYFGGFIAWKVWEPLI